MLFKPEHVPMILSGKKTATRRNWKSPRVKVGNVYKCKTKMLSKDSFAEIVVHKVYKQALYFMTDKDARKEGYRSMEEFHKIWVEINGEWNPNLVVYVIEFEAFR